MGDEKEPKKGPAVNYLNIQLRDMDYDNYYRSVEAKFLDPKKYYYGEKYSNGDKSVFQEGFEKAFLEAEKTLNQHISGGKVRTDSLKKIFIKIYQKKIEREKNFLQAWKNHYNKTNSLSDGQNIVQIGDIPVPPSLNDLPSLESMLVYATKFSIFIKKLLGANLNSEDSLIIKTLRDSGFVEQIAGQSSAVFSTRAVKRAETQGKKTVRSNQSLINSYYEELFGVFCLNRHPNFIIGTLENKEGAVLDLASTLEELQKNRRINPKTKTVNKTTPQKVFQENFKKFIDKYYPEISQQIGKDFFKNVSKNFEKIYKLKGEDTKSSIILQATTQDRGVSYENEQQLKKMLLETFRQGAGANGNYSRFEIPGLLEIHERWDTGAQFFHKEIQMTINDLRNYFAEEGQEGKDRRFRYDNIHAKDIDKLIESGELSEAELERLKLTRQNVREFADYFFEWLIGQLRKYTGHPFSDDAKKKLRSATIAKLSRRETWGNELLKKLSAFGPQQVRGLMGEIATAYALEAGSKLQNEIVGASQSTSGTGQKHYDVEAVIGQVGNIGFQVKNYKTGKQIKGLYATSLGLGTQAMYRYFSKEDVKNYRWLFANGVFLSNKGGKYQFKGEESLRKKMEESFLDAIPYFLRIGDAANGSLEDQVNSDIYVIGDYYYPASYLIVAAYDAARRKVKDVNSGKSGVKRLITITGKFPNYSQKYAGEGYFREKNYTTDPTTGEKVWTRTYSDTDRKRFNQKRVSSTGRSRSYEKANLVVIDRYKTRVLDATINFSGITIDFVI